MIAAPETSVGTGVRPSSLVSRLANLVDRRPGLVLPVWIFAYFAVLWRAAHRPLWFDELFTYYVSTAATWERFWGGIRFLDLNPPLSYFLVRSSIALFGDSPFVTRIPSMLGFLLAGLIVFRLVTRRLGGGMGLAALGLLWSFSLTAYAVEARPYGLLLGLSSVAMLCWLNAIEASRWTKWHTGLASAIAGMLLTHCFSPTFAAALCAGELVRAIVARRIDRNVWAALLSPLILVALYIPLVKNAQAVLYPPAFEAKVSTIPLFYMRILVPALPAIGVIAVIWLIGAGGKKGVPRDPARLHEIAFCLGALAVPAVIAGYCIWSGVAFFDRYGIDAILGGCLLLTGWLANVTKRKAEASVAAAGLILVLFCVVKPGIHAVMERNENVSRSYLTVDPQLPFVAACGLTFLEMDHRESPEFVKRLYYLMDRESSVAYVHSTNFENYPLVQRWFPTRANVGPYHEFVKYHRKFLVLTAHDCPTDWLLFKLRDDGAQIRFLQDLKTGYYDRELYEVTFPGE